MATWWVNQPQTTLFLKDKPLFYNTSRGHQLAFKLQYKGNPGPNGIVDASQYGIFGVGTNWHTPWRSYLVPVSMASANDAAIIFLGDGSARIYYIERTDYSSSSFLQKTNDTYILTFANGSRRIYESWVTLSTNQYCFVTRFEDAQGLATQFSYSCTTSGGVTNSIRLNQVTDVDNNTISFTYTNTSYYSNLIAEVRAPHGLTNRLDYGSNGQLTNITDVIGLTSGMAYDSSNRVSQLTTAYGTTKFSYYGTNAWKALRVEEMGIRNHFYLEGFDSSAIWPTAESEGRSLATYLSNASITESVETNGFAEANTFYWAPLQYQNLQSSIRTKLRREVPPTHHPCITSRQWRLES